MATYAIGDIQGCYREFMALLNKIGFDPMQDKLWLIGDLINRGPDSLSVLRYVMSLKDSAVVVLGNHDMYLLKAALGLGRKPEKDTLEDIFEAPEFEEIIYWLRCQKMFHYDKKLNMCMVHAGVPPVWSFKETMQHAQELSTLLKSKHIDRNIIKMYGDSSEPWHKIRTNAQRIRYATNVFTRLRFCSMDGTLALKMKHAPSNHGHTSDATFAPWYTLAPEWVKEKPIVFGHWSTLQLSSKENRKFRVYPLDSGCVWGRHLTAMRLEDKKIFTALAFKAKNQSADKVQAHR